VHIAIAIISDGRCMVPADAPRVPDRENIVRNAWKPATDEPYLAPDFSSAGILPETGVPAF